MQPRNVRNFWLEAEIDGRKDPLKGGPRQSDGGMIIRLYQRHRGHPFQVLEISCRTYEDEIVSTHVKIDDPSPDWDACIIPTIDILTAR